MSMYSHIAAFIYELKLVADVDDRSVGAEALKAICIRLNISVLRESSRPGPETYFFHLEFPGNMYPKKVFVKSIYHGEVLASRYKALSKLHGFDSIMTIYGLSQYWLVCALVPELPGVSPQTDMTQLQRILCAVDVLVHMHKLDVSDLISNELFRDDLLSIESFSEWLDLAQKQVARENVDNPQWDFIFKWLIDNHELSFSLFRDFNTDKLVLYHGDFHHLNFMWRYYNAVNGWACAVIDWDNASVSVPWADIAYLLIPHYKNDPPWQYDEVVISHYALRFGINDEYHVQKILGEYYQYRIWQGLFHVAEQGTEALEQNWLSFLVHYVDELNAIIFDN